MIKKFIHKLIFPNDEKPSHVKALDGLRGFAVLAVALSHLSNNGILLSDYLHFGRLGTPGVFLFFILSSFLLDKQIALAIRSGNSTIFYWINYALRRILRIYPLYIFILIVYHQMFLKGYTYCICLQLEESIWKHLRLEQANGVFWSIPVELKYYLISPVIMVFYAYLFRWKKYLVSLSTIAIAGWINYYTFQNGYFMKNHLETWPYLPVFLVGSLLAVFHVLSKNNLSALTKNQKKIIETFGIISLFLILFFGTNILKYILPESFRSILDVYRRMTLMPAILFGFILLACLHGTGWLQKLFSNNVLRFIGVISFSFYLIHFSVVKYVKTLEFEMFDATLKIVIFFFISILLSLFTYLFIEFPFSKIKMFNKEKLYFKSTT